MQPWASILQKLGIFAIFPLVYALIGMGAVLGAVVHAPLAAILILLELTSDYHIILPAMLATICAVGTARFLFAESIYTPPLRDHGVRLGSTRDAGASAADQHRADRHGAGERDPGNAVPSRAGHDGRRRSRRGCRAATTGSISACYAARISRRPCCSPDSIPLLVAGELTRPGIPLLSSVDDLAKAMEVFAQADVETLAVALPEAPGKVVGVISQNFMVRRYHEVVDENR